MVVGKTIVGLAREFPNFCRTAFGAGFFDEGDEFFFLQIVEVLADSGRGNTQQFGQRGGVGRALFFQDREYASRCTIDGQILFNGGGWSHGTEDYGKVYFALL